MHGPSLFKVLASDSKSRLKQDHVPSTKANCGRMYVTWETVGKSSEAGQQKKKVHILKR